MSISKAQAEALADGFLDDIGTGNPNELQPRETISELLLLAGELVEDAQKNLDNTKSNASGELSKSIEANEPTTAPGLIQIDIEMNFYGQFVNKGVKGTKEGSGLYAFKSDMPGRKMLKSIEQYIKDAKSKLRSVKQHIGYENKNKGVSDANSAFAMARAVKQHGIKPTFFMDKAINDTDKKVSERLGDALAIDVLNSLPDKLN
jgi:hypothetical protein